MTSKHIGRACDGKVNTKSLSYLKEGNLMSLFSKQAEGDEREAHVTADKEEAL